MHKLTAFELLSPGERKVTTQMPRATAARFTAFLTSALLMLLCLALPASAWNEHQAYDKRGLTSILGLRLDRVFQGGPVTIPNGKNGPIRIETTINPGLQKKAMALLTGLKTHRAALVVVDAETGMVLALAGAKSGRPAPYLALQAEAPAASLFKVITAAAALEQTPLQPESKLKFTGRAHTLYRFQLKEKQKRKGRKISLKQSFADSNNPIFARLGIYRVGEGMLTAYAKALGFATPLTFELPVAMSNLPNPDNSFQVGELACGFNRHTTTSALHAALMVSVFVNGGRFMEPFIIKNVTTPSGELLYQGKPQGGKSLLTRETCLDMRELMRATVTKGTARRAFRRLHRDRVLRELEIGGKTGTLRGPERKELYQWFAGYARDPKTDRAISVAVMMGHLKTQRGNPKKVARQIMRQAFQVCFKDGRYVCGPPAASPQKTKRMAHDSGPRDDG